MSENTSQLQHRLERLRSHYPGRTDAELMEIRRFLDRYIEIALSIYLEATEESSRETTS